MALCEKAISTCIAADCDNPVFAGMEATAWIFNKSDIDTITYLQDTENKDIKTVVTGITLKSGKTGYTVQQLGKQPFTGSSITMNVGDYGNTFSNQLNLMVPDNSIAASRGIIDQLAGGKFVVIFENSYDGSDNQSKYQIFGLNKGLSASEITNEKYSDSSMGGWSVVMTEENVGLSGVFFYTTSLSDTKAAIEALVDNCVQEEETPDSPTGE